jgi:hypothetical protein
MDEGVKRVRLRFLKPIPNSWTTYAHEPARFYYGSHLPRRILGHIVKIDDRRRHPRGLWPASIGIRHCEGFRNRCDYGEGLFVSLREISKD